MDPRWHEVADSLTWEAPPRTMHEPGPHGGSWFPGGRLNACTNLLDRHLATRADQPALHWEGEPGDRRTLTYRNLHDEVTAVSDALAGLGVTAGDRVALHTGLLPESIAIMLACMRLGATYSVMPAVLPPEAITARLEDLAPRVLVTQDGAWRHGVVLPLKARADEALAAAGTVEHTVVIRRTGVDVPWFEGDRWLHQLLARPRPGVAAAPRPPAEPVAVESGHPIHVSHLANRRGRPAGIVHPTAGLLAYCAAVEQAFAPQPGAVVWSPAEFAWLACQTHGIIGPLVDGATAVAYEGMLDTPGRDRAWQIIERYGVTTLLATPSVLRAVRRWRRDPPSPEQVASLELLVTAGEPLEPDTEQWLREDVGRGRIPVINAWGQSELGGLVYADHPPLADRLPDPGLSVLDDRGQHAGVGTAGMLVLTEPWPARAGPVWGTDDLVPGSDPSLPDVHVTGDRARVTEDGIEFLGRADHVFSVSGQLVSATEVEDVLLEHPFVLAVVVVDRADPHTGRAVAACVATTGDVHSAEGFAAELRTHVHNTLGGLAQPQSVLLVDKLPEDADPATTRAALASLATSSTDPVTTLSAAAVDAAIQAAADG